MRVALALTCLSSLLFVEMNAYVIPSTVLQQVMNDKATIYKGRKEPLRTAEGKALCTTAECVTAAAELINAMDMTADPCQDFFQYACGGWIKNHPIPESKSRWTQFDLLRDELSAEIKNILSEAQNANDAKPVNDARVFYTTCMDTDTLEQLGLKPLTDLLALFGGWPMTLSNWDSASFDWQAASAAGRKLYGTSYFLSVYNYLDSNNTKQSSLYIDQSSLVLPRTTLANPDETSPLLKAYAAYITGTAKAIRDALGSTATDAEIDAQVKEVWQFESELAKITTPDEDRRNNTRMYNPLLLTQIQKWTDDVNPTNAYAKIDWSKYLNDIYGLASINIPANERIIVVETEYLKKLVALLDKTPLKTIANYMHWRFVNALGSYTTQKMRDLAFEFSKVQLGVTTPTARTITCANQANNLIGFAVSAKYVERNFDENAKLQTELLIANLKTAFKTLVDEANWMDSATKAIAREKADYMIENVAYPDWIKNKTALETYYSGLAIKAGEHFSNVQAANSFLNTEDFKTLRLPTDRTRWTTFPSIVNAFYEPQINSITFPAGILQSPFFLYKRLAVMNYGAIGTVIGHEITHGFDDQGRQSDKDGNTANWWTDDTLQKYLSRAQCFIDQYSNFTVPSGSHINGVNTQGENIADNGGIREAFLAYNFFVAANGAEPQLPGFEKFTAEQIFFLSYGNLWCGTETPQGLENQLLTDPHSPSKYRVLGPLSNSQDFANAFNCTAGTPMNPVGKCVIW